VTQPVAGQCDPRFEPLRDGPRWQNPRTQALVDAVYESLAR
jgi:hypothetical protein